MTVVIDFEHDGTLVNEDGESGWLMLDDTESETTRPKYASWPFYTEDYDGEKIGTWWTWENPEDPIEEITLSPSLVLEWDDPNTFHIFIKDGEVEHCNDCMCGC